MCLKAGFGGEVLNVGRVGIDEVLTGTLDKMEEQDG